MYQDKMWLINTSTFQLHEFTGSAPPYATFSYDMGENKATFEDFLQIPRYLCRDSIKIIEKACSQVRTTGSSWLWNHGACVEKRSSAAQSEAINALAQIYRGCEQSIIYLEDFDLKSPAKRTIREKLAGCRWINNIWAIPQIVFPTEAYFYSSDWTRIGTKSSLFADLSFTMGIDQPVLEDSNCLEDYSIARKMSWASRATALRIEDCAYALIGLFNVSMSIVYGEGHKAFRRLQELIMRDTDDFSLLAWEALGAQEFYGLFAPSLSCFERFRTGEASPLRLKGEAQIHCSGFTVQTSFWKTETGLFLPLESQDGLMCSIPLVQWNGCFVRRATPVKWGFPGPVSVETMRICVKRDVTAYVSRKISTTEGISRKNSFDSLESLDQNTTAGGSRNSVTDYGSNYGTGSRAPSVEGCAITSQDAPTMPLAEDTPHEDFTAQSIYDRNTMEGALSALDIDARASWVNEPILDIDATAESYLVDDTEEAANPSPYVEVRSSEGACMNEMPAVEAPHLDVVKITKELAHVATAQFLAGHQRQSNKRCFTPTQEEARKRKRLMQSADQFERDNTSETEVMEAIPVPNETFIACPFYIRNNEHRNCVTRHRLRSIEDVTEHIILEHRRRMYCPICKEEFVSGRDRDSHIRLRNCHPNDSVIPEGITDRQEEQLDREMDGPLAEDLRWFQIWDIAFPHEERPVSAFHTGEREVRVCAFREFWTQHGEQLIASFLEKKDCQSYSIKNEERTLRAIYDRVEESVADRLYGDFGNITVNH